MQMSSACTPPTQPRGSADQSHPKYAEYSRYLSACSAQLVTGCSFQNWLQQFEDKSGLVVFQHCTTHLWGWWNSNAKGFSTATQPAEFDTEEQAVTHAASLGYTKRRPPLS